MNFVCRLKFIDLDTLVYLERRPCTSGIVSFEYIVIHLYGQEGCLSFLLGRSKRPALRKATEYRSYDNLRDVI